MVLVSSIREGFFVLKPREHITTPIEADDLPISSVHAVLYPNPLHTQANLILNLNRSQQVSINVFDTMGRFRARLFEGMLAQGEHRFSFDASQLPNGIYLIRIAGKYFAVNRMATVVN